MAVARRTPYIRAALLQLPLFLLMFGMASVSMMVPALHALIVDNETTARAFFYAGLVTNDLTGGNTAHRHLALTLTQVLHGQPGNVPGQFLDVGCTGSLDVFHGLCVD